MKTINTFAGALLECFTVLSVLNLKTTNENLTICLIFCEIPSYGKLFLKIQLVSAKTWEFVDFKEPKSVSKIFEL